jgi:hypothetical protein
LGEELAAGAESLNYSHNSLLNISAESVDNLQEHLAATQGVLGILQKEVYLLKEELKSRSVSEPPSPETASEQERMLILCRADSLAETGALSNMSAESLPGFHAKESEEATIIGGKECNILTQFSRRRAGRVDPIQQEMISDSEEIIELKGRIVELQKAREASEVKVEQLTLQNKVDINWYENQLQALEDDSFQLSIARSKVSSLWVFVQWAGSE